MSKTGLSIAAVLAVALAACSSVPYAQRQQQRQAAYAAAAGAPVKSFHFFNMWSWEPLSDSELVVYTQPSRAWLLDLDGPCQNLEFTRAIGLTSSVGEVSTRFDRVLTGRGYIPCTIMQIRPIDVKRLRIEQEAQRKINAQPREPAAPASGS
ncbi:hypothetical protein B0E47_07120 [Rhodanobacter sp. B05]|uniref:DUF6491 family protein n=1 Tax=Rhodanobacter sp. B05 TaxID=1945859 RepID=UPI000985D106|nr:DUF6491 family protein [Rhodanobacter sp. B05]OOG57088.1 hypothetical protein B0E47_07120 [Rhodanobacter sp. B05]